MMPVRWVIPHLCGLPKAVRDKRVLLMFRGFFDESNRNPSERQFILAGWTARVEDWELFTADWRECLSQEPSINYFKTYEANNQTNDFYKFSEAAAIAKKLALARVISKHKVRGYIATADHTILSGKPERLSKFMGTRIYDWAFIAIVTCVLGDHLERGEKLEKVDFVFDGCSELRACIESYEETRDNKFLSPMQAIAGEAIPGDDKELAGLQAADLLAGEHSAYLQTGIKGDCYMEFADLPIMEFPATPPLQIVELLQHAQGVYRRKELVSDMLNLLKQKGVKLDDFKES